MATLAEIQKKKLPSGQTPQQTFSAAKETPAQLQIEGAKQQATALTSLKAGAAAPILTPEQQVGQAGDMMAPSTGLPPEPTVTGETPPAGETPPVTTESLVGQFQEQAEAARAANLERYGQGLDIHQQIADIYAPGGSFGQGQMEQYQRRKAKDVAAQRQQLISSGLASTTVAAGLERGYEADVGTPFRAQLADIQSQRYAEAMGGKAGFIERREDVAPSPELMAGLVTQAESRPGDADYGVAGADADAGAGAGVEAGIGGDTWSSGAMGAISRRQYKTEKARQGDLAKATKNLERYDKKVSGFETKLAKYEDLLAKYPDDPKKQAKYQKKIDTYKEKIAKYEGKADAAEGDMEKYANVTAAISATQFAQEQQRRGGQQRLAASEANLAASRAMTYSRIPGTLKSGKAGPAEMWQDDPRSSYTQQRYTPRVSSGASLAGTAASNYLSAESMPGYATATGGTPGGGTMTMTPPGGGFGEFVEGQMWGSPDVGDQAGPLASAAPQYSIISKDRGGGSRAIPQGDPIPTGWHLAG